MYSMYSLIWTTEVCLKWENVWNQERIRNTFFMALYMSLKWSKVWRFDLDLLPSLSPKSNLINMVPPGCTWGVLGTVSKLDQMSGKKRKYFRLRNKHLKTQNPFLEFYSCFSASLFLQLVNPFWCWGSALCLQPQCDIGHVRLVPRVFYRPCFLLICFCSSYVVQQTSNSYTPIKLHFKIQWVKKSKTFNMTYNLYNSTEQTPFYNWGEVLRLVFSTHLSSVPVSS